MRTRTSVRFDTGWGVGVLVLGSLIVLGGMRAAEKGEAPPGEWIGWLLFPLAGLVVLVRGRMAGVRTDDQGVHIRNIWRSHFYQWSEVERFALGPVSRIMAVGRIELSGGRESPMHAIRTTSLYFEPLVDRLNATLRLHRDNLQRRHGLKFDAGEQGAD
jgi:hypothetical protein